MTAPEPRQAPRRAAGLRLVAAVTDRAYRHRAWVALAALGLSAVSIRFAARLDIHSSFADLLPSNLPSVRLMQELLRRIGGDGTLLVSIEREGDRGSLAKAEAWVPRLAAELRALGPSEVRAVEEGSADAERWYVDHWPLFVSLPELEQADRDLAEEIHRRKVAQNPLAIDLGASESRAPLQATPWLSDPARLPRSQARARFADHPDGFYVHPDGRSVTFIVRPAGTSLDVATARALLTKAKAIVAGHAAELERDGLRVGFSGTFPQLVAEYAAIVHDLRSTAFWVVLLVLAVLLAFYRELLPVLALLGAIGVAIAATFGLTELTIGFLNTQTAFLGAIVVGNGINYGLVYLARLRQLRDRGDALPDALRGAAVLAARATLLASAASSLSFAVLAVASNRGFRDFGFIGGVGMLLCWLATFALLPAFLGLLDGLRPARRTATGSPESGDARLAHPQLARVFSHPRGLATAMLGAAALGLGLFVARLPSAMETHLVNLSNALSDRADQDLVRDNQRANEAIDQSTAAAYVLLPTLEEAESYCDQIRSRMLQPEVAKVVQGCDTLGSVLPRAQPQKLAVIRRIASRLTDGVLETLPPAEADGARAVRAELLAQRAVTAADAPAALIGRFREKDGRLGGFAIVTARHDAKLEVSPNLLSFARAVKRVPVAGTTFDATGENVILADLLADINREGPRTTLLSFLGVCVLVLLFFREWSRRLEVLVSLIAGVSLMAGVGTLLGLKINFFNFITFPVTFGIAVDYGANIAARIRARGGQVFPALVEVGPAVFLCSLTSMIGYATLFSSINRALRSFGWYALVGEVTSVFAALVLLPARALGWRHSSRRLVGSPKPASVAA